MVGAVSYDLRMLSTNEIRPFAVRDGSVGLPYSFNKETTEFLSSWARNLGDHTLLSLLVLDEFGPVEADGGGHMALWPSIQNAQPEIVAMAVRVGVEKAIEDRLDQNFDLTINVQDPEAWSQLRTACTEHGDWARIGVYGAGAGGIEVTVGSALHGARVPMRGLVLSSIQSVVMTYAADGLGHRGRVVWVPFIAAGLKALSPAGERLRPMVAITVQGLLFGGAIRILGWNSMGILIAGWLVGAWAGAQGILFQYLFIGSELFRAYDEVIRWVTSQWRIEVPGIITLLTIWVVVWGVVASVVTLMVWRRRRLPARIQTFLDRGAQAIRWEESRPSWKQAVQRGFKDLFRPIFWVPVAVVAVIVLVSGSPWETAFWIVARAVTVGMVTFSLARAFDLRSFIAWLQGKGHWGPAVAFRRAMTNIDRKAPPSQTRKPDDI
jgi:hypothetical protein